MKLGKIYEVYIDEYSETTKIMDSFNVKNSSGNFVYDTLMFVNASSLDIENKYLYVNLYIQRTNSRIHPCPFPDISFTDFKKNYSNRRIKPSSSDMDIIGEEVCKTLSKCKISLEPDSIDLTMELDEWIPFHAQSSIYRKNTKYGDSSHLHIVGFRLLSTPLKPPFHIRSWSPIYDYISACSEVTSPSFTRAKSSLLKMEEKWKDWDNRNYALLAKNAFSFFVNDNLIYAHLYFKFPRGECGKDIPLSSFSNLIGGNTYTGEILNPLVEFYIDKILRLYHNPTQEYSYKMNWDCSMWEKLILDVYDYDHLEKPISVQLIKVKFTSKPL